MSKLYHKASIEKKTPNTNDQLEHSLYIERALTVSVHVRNKDFVEDDGVFAGTTDLKVIAYYLPQFHPTPENDTFWGKGFTEWRNVTRAFPLFKDHYQPRVPGELGFYDLRVPDVMRRQVQLARQYGVYGFCFYFYWFGGTRILELPILHFHEDKSLDINFSLCWANENWSRTWDASNNEVLIQQSHSDDDDIAFIRYLERYFRDERYIKVDGKPVLTVYRPQLLPAPGKTIARWRAEAKSMGFPGIYLIATNARLQSSDQYTEYSGLFDAVSEFPPHCIKAVDLSKEIQTSVVRTGGTIYSYQSIVDHELIKKIGSGITIHPGTMLNWDNSARKPFNGNVYVGGTPDLFAKWLRNCAERARDNPLDQRFIYINAWNEWAEGSYLEPDQRFGYAWLRVVREIVTRNP